MRSMRTLASFKDTHRGETFVVCGCGESLNELTQPERFVTIGVNDVGRRFQPDYLVVVNPRHQFAGDRFRYVEHSRARFIFTQLNLGLRRDNIVQVRLGRYGGTDCINASVLHYTRNSPYVALCLAVLMGARRVGLIGVDFTDHHFFARTGRHQLTGQLARIDAEYRALGEALAQAGIEVLNLSARSRLTAFPKIALEDFARDAGLPAQTPTVQVQREQAPRSVVSSPAVGLLRREWLNATLDKYSPGLLGDMFDTLAETLARIGVRVSRRAHVQSAPANSLAVVWNGRMFRPSGPVLYCEHGWLPRWDYQISHRGINADSHLAPFRWDGRPLADAQREQLARHLASLREHGPKNHHYMRPDLHTATDLPDAFLLVPFQIQGDTNILRHVPPQFRHMQALVDRLSQLKPPLPLVFKQHPADERRGNQHLRLRLRRPQDQLRRHDDGNIHQILKSGRCRGIISLNSNVVHDGLIWDVPAVVLGRNIWPQRPPAPFFMGLPQDWREVERFWASRETELCREAYAHYIMQNQWSLTDLSDEEKVAMLVNSAWSSAPAKRAAGSVARRTSQRVRPVLARPAAVRQVVKVAPVAGRFVNVVARNLGWFFEDLKRHFSNAKRPGLNVVATQQPRTDAHAWVFIRTREAAGTPDPARTVVQIHDLYEDGLYAPGGERRIVERCSALVLTHPAQQQILERAGISHADKDVVIRPIGALKTFTLRETLAPQFTIGWVGRPVMRDGVEVKRVQWLVDAVKQLDLPHGALRVSLLGERLEHIHAQFTKAGIACDYHRRAQNPIEKYPAHYRNFDCLVITSATSAKSLPLFEALSSGVPVISTSVGWAPMFIQEGMNGLLFNDVDGLAAALRRIFDERATWFARRQEIRTPVDNFTLESWIADNLNLALRLSVERHVAA